MPRKYLRIEDAAEYLATNKWHIYELCKRPNDPLPHRRPGKALLFEQSQIDRWVDRQPGRGGDGLEEGGEG